MGLESIKILIFIGAFSFTGRNKNQILVAASLLLNNLKPENKNMMLLQEPVKEFKLPNLERSIHEDAFDEIELLSFPISCTVFDLLETKYRGDVMSKNLLIHHKKQVKILAYIISMK